MGTQAFNTRYENRQLRNMALLYHTPPDFLFCENGNLYSYFSFALLVHSPSEQTRFRADVTIPERTELRGLYPSDLGPRVSSSHPLAALILVPPLGFSSYIVFIGYSSILRNGLAVLILRGRAVLRERVVGTEMEIDRRYRSFALYLLYSVFCWRGYCYIHSLYSFAQGRR